MDDLFHLPLSRKAFEELNQIQLVSSGLVRTENLETGLQREIQQGPLRLSCDLNQLNSAFQISM